ncbi:solute carrier family 22 member 21 [Plakobranchus ocellatus]|uniref:Solute carrier family 22 member 21 n=1 Tax=Plakobranchus ocellatus TaxID=259542 RepID=A0AAV4A0E2_9GAST|nr:solute carrier family 22 member 21 [Plakobranchus ocellatus]
MATTLDDLIGQLGSCGPFQSILTVAIQSAVVVSVWGIMMMAFGGYNPGWVCEDGDLHLHWNVSSSDSAADRGLTSDDNQNFSTRIQSSPNATDKCLLFSKCQNVSFLPGSSTIVSEWGLVCDDEWTPSIIFTVQMVGVLMGAYIAGHLGDCVGRRASLYSMVALSAVANLLAIFSPSWEIFATFRFFIGAAAGGILTTYYTIPMEFMGQFWRGLVGSIPMWNIGAALFSVAVLILRDWRQIHLLTAAISLLVFLPVIWVPESLRWLVVHGSDEKARAVAYKIARVNGRPRPKLEVLQEVTETERIKAELEISHHYSYIDLFRDQKVRKVTLIMGFLWISMAFIYYGISFSVQALSGDFYINFLIFSVMEIPGMAFVIPALTFLGRRKGSIAHFLGVAIASFAVVPVMLLLESDQENDEIAQEATFKGKLLMGLTLVAKMLVIGTWAVITVFCGELFPTVVRNLGFGFLNAAARIGGMIGPVLFPRDPDLLHIVLVGMGILALICSGLLLALPETKGVSLTDVISSENVKVKKFAETDDGGAGGSVEENSKHDGSEVFLPLKTMGDIPDASPKRGDLRLLGPPSGQGADGGARTRDGRVLADLRADSLTTTELPTPHCDNTYRVNKRRVS